MLTNVKPSRSKASDNVVIDLDSLVLEPFSFKLNGVVHQIKPISTEQFFKITNYLARLNNFQKEIKETGKIEQADILLTYNQLFVEACDTLTAEDITGMEIPQRAALLELIIDVVKGRAHVDYEKKNSKIVN